MLWQTIVIRLFEDKQGFCEQINSAYGIFSNSWTHLSIEWSLITEPHKFDWNPVFYQKKKKERNTHTSQKSDTGFHLQHKPYYEISTISENTNQKTQVHMFSGKA